jgi:DNA-binding MarR family transcriptional regulator
MTGNGHAVKSGAYVGIDNTNGSTSIKRSVHPKKFVNRWGKIKQIHVLNAIIRDGKLELSSPALAVLLTLLNQNKNKEVKDTDVIATVRVGQEKLIERTGFGKNTITDAVTELEKKLYLKRVENRKKKGEFGTNGYILCNPQNGEPLAASRTPYMGKVARGYFTVPDCIVKETGYNWSLAKIGESELRLYTVLLYLGNQHRDNEFTTTAAEMRELSGLSQPTLKKAIPGLEERGLILVSGDFKSNCTVNLCDPYTGVPLEPYTGDDRDDPSNYYETVKDGRSKRLNLNIGDPVKIEKLLRELIPDGQSVIEHSKGQLMICCPFHKERTPSCSVNPQWSGGFHCFGCHEHGSFTKLIARIKGITQGKAIEQTAVAFGKTAEFHDPDYRAIAKYSFCDANGKLLKQVLRYPDENGKKKFKQRQPGKGDWKWSVADLPPMLFHMEFLDIAGVVCITEGERDALTVTNLHMSSIWGLVIGMTSGGAETWDASLAKHLHDKKVVIMPDNDDAGRRYAADVKASLEAEGIEYREVTFQDAGVKDVTEYKADHTVEDLVRKIGTDWVRMPDGTKPEDESVPQAALIGAAGADYELGRITI